MDRRDFIGFSTLVASTSLAGGAADAAMRAAPLSSSSNLVLTAAAASITPMDFTKLSKSLDAVAPLGAGRDLEGNFVLAPAAPNEIPDILQPIDVGADELLNTYTKSQLQYSPYEIEYLSTALVEHILNCKNLREKAQQLEVLASAARLELILERKTIEFSEALADFDATYNPHIAGAMYDPQLSGTKFASSSDAPDIYNKRRQIEQQLVDARKEQLSARLALLRQPGSGNNHAERFGSIKDEFALELTEAYLKVRSLAVGCKELYGININSLPEPTKVGYLNRLDSWSKKTSVLLDRALLGKTSILVAIGLRKGGDAASVPGLLSEADFNAGRSSGSFNFKITPELFAAQALSLTRPRIRALEVYTYADGLPKAPDYVRVKVTMPDQSIGSGIPKLWSMRPTIYFPLATAPQGAEFAFQSRREVYNASPIGDWSLTLEKRTIMDRDATKDEVVRNLFLVMRLTTDMTS